ncbi:MAG TPA: MlaD family protein [Gemmatimonadaceae bacterium]|nr:MlaD family protein [Gemmatimonadaceae bacterium]
MRRSKAITWDQLKVGLLILIAAAVLAVAVFKLGQTANLFAGRYHLYVLLPNAEGVREGGSVTLAGQLAGRVDRIEFLPPDGDSTRNLRLRLAIDRSVQSQVRENSRARLRTQGLLGDRLVDITPGTPAAPVLPENDTIASAPGADYEEVLTQVATVVHQLSTLTADLRGVTQGLLNGEGSAGQFLTNRTMYDALESSLRRTDVLLTRIERGEGTLGRMLVDTTVYARLASTTSALDTIVRRIADRRGTLGKLIADDTLYTRLAGISTSADSLLKMVAAGQGTLGRLIGDQALYDELTRTIADLNAILQDIQRNPRKYTRGMVKLF